MARCGMLDVVIDHYGEPDIAGRADKANRYSSMLADLARRSACLRLRMVPYPAGGLPALFPLRGHYRSGWAGFIAARIQRSTPSSNTPSCTRQRQPAGKRQRSGQSGRRPRQ